MFDRRSTTGRPALAALLIAGAATLATPAHAEPWQFSLTTYGWLSGLEGDVGVFPALPPVKVDLSFTDVLGKLKFVTMNFAEARKDRFIVLADLTYTNIGTSEGLSIRDTEIAEIRLGSKNLMATLGAGYRVAEGTTRFDLIGGLRVTGAYTDVRLRRINGTELSADSDKTWVDPIVGARVNTTLGPKWSFAGYADIGGFGVSSDFTWQVIAAFQYQISQRLRISAGYRHYEVDFEDDGFIFDTAMSGPIIGITTTF